MDALTRLTEPHFARVPRPIPVRTLKKGEDKAVITVKVVRCRMCNVQDQVLFCVRV